MGTFDGGSQNGVAADDFRERAIERVNVERALQPEDPLHIVKTRARIQLLLKP